MSATTAIPEQVLLIARETRRSAGLLRGVLAPLACLALMGGLPYLELHLLSRLGLDPYYEVAAGVGVGVVLLLLWWLSFLGRQKVTVTNERVLVESGFWNHVRDDVEVFRLRDVVVTRSIWARMLGVGNVTIKATGGLGQAEEVHELRGLAGPVAVAEAIRQAWNIKGRPQRTSNIDG